MGIGIHYQDIRTEEDFRKWAREHIDPKNIHVEFDGDLFMHTFCKGVSKHHLNLMVFDKSKLLSICEELGIEQRKF